MAYPHKVFLHPAARRFLWTQDLGDRHRVADSLLILWQGVLRNPGTGPGPTSGPQWDCLAPSVWTSGLLLSAQAARLVGEVPDSAALSYFQLKLRAGFSTPNPRPLSNSDMGGHACSQNISSYTLGLPAPPHLPTSSP